MGHPDGVEKYLNNAKKMNNPKYKLRDGDVFRKGRRGFQEREEICREEWILDSREHRRYVLMVILNGSLL
jgi:hypothetical protein